MTITINNKVIDKWESLSVSLIYNCVASVFSFDIYWNPDDAGMRDIMLPGAYNECTIKADSGEILITGVMHSPAFKSNNVANLVNISGYSRTGVLDDCEYSALFSTPQSNDLTLLQICQSVCDRFGFGAVVDKTNGAASAAKYISTDTDGRGKSCTEYISDLAEAHNITLSHNAAGDLVLSVAKDTKAVYDFTQGMPGIEYDLSFNGQQMHSTIIAATEGGTTQNETALNPYVNNRFNATAAAANDRNILNISEPKLSLKNEYSTGYRPHAVTLSDGDDIKAFVKKQLANELQAISLSIKIKGWQVNGRILRPEDIVSVKNKELYLFKKVNFFVQSVDFTGNSKDTECTLKCVVPEVFNGKEPINIFTANGNSGYYDTPSTTPKEGDKIGRQPNL